MQRNDRTIVNNFPQSRLGVIIPKTAVFFLAGYALTGVWLAAQTPPVAQPVNFTATSDNVTGAKDSIKIELRRWSADDERSQVLSAWTKAAAPAAPLAAGRGGADAAAAEAPQGRRGRGGDTGPAVRLTPQAALTAALGNAPAVGTIWSSETTGYSVHYAAHTTEPDGSERIVLLTDRRLGASNNLWRPAGSAAANDYEFSLVELHLNAKGEGEGKISNVGKVVVDSAGKAITLENYSASPVVLRNLKRGQ